MICFTRESLQSSAGIHLALLLLLLLLLHVCLFCSFENLPLQQGSHACMQFGILPMQQGNSRRRRVHAVWYPATASDCRALVGSLKNCRCSRAAICAPMQFENLPLQPGSSHVAARELSVRWPLAGSLVIWAPANAASEFSGLLVLSLENAVL
jgi:hypothetical protein